MTQRIVQGQIRVERWRVLELGFTAQLEQSDPYRNLELDTIFTHESGLELKMPAFWDGEQSWKVRFAAPEPGIWNYITHCSNARENGLHLQSGSFEVQPYGGNLALYQHGFLKVSKNSRYLEHADGTPFYWLGDTHWLGLCARERFDTSNDPRFTSQFKGIIEQRLEQGYTVWAGSLMVGEWNDASGSPTPLWGTYLEGGEHPWVGTGYRITASSGIHQVDFTPLSEGHAIDGYPDTRWEAGVDGFPQWLCLDLGDELELGHADLHFPTLERQSYRFEGSKDGLSFTTLIERVEIGVADSFSETLTGVARYVRVVLTGSSAARASLSEFSVYDASGKLHGNQSVLKVLNPAYWKLLDRRVQFLAESGLLLNLGLDWGRNLQRSPAMLEDYQRVARYVLARYGAYPSVYFIAGEPQQSTHFEGWQQVLEKMHRLDPYRRPLTLHTYKLPETRGFGSGSLELQTPVDRSAVGFAFTHLQTEEYGKGRHELEEWYGEYHARPTLPMIEAETGYEKEAGDGYEQRWAAWQSQMAGACGYTYGAYGIWSATWDDLDTWNTFGTHVNWSEAIDFVGGEQMRHVATFFRAIPWHTLGSYSGAITWHGAPQTPHAKPLEKVSPDHGMVVAYLPRSTEAYRGTLRGLNISSTYRARWYDPRNGGFLEIVTGAPAEQGTLEIPVQPDPLEDWMLLVEEQR